MYNKNIYFEIQFILRSIQSQFCAQQNLFIKVKLVHKCNTHLYAMNTQTVSISLQTYKLGFAFFRPIENVSAFKSKLLILLKRLILWILVLTFIIRLGSSKREHRFWLEHKIHSLSWSILCSLHYKLVVNKIIR